MLNAEQLNSNKEKFLLTNKKYNIFNDELLNFLGDDFFTAPASLSLDLYGCYPGGLLNHLLTSCKYAVQFNEALPEKMRQDKASIIRCVFLSQIGKVFLFVLNTNEYQKKIGKMYDFREDKISMNMTERAIFYILKCNVKVTELEYQAIINSNKDDTDKIAKYHSEILSHLIKTGLEFGILEEKNGQK